MDRLNLSPVSALAALCVAVLASAALLAAATDVGPHGVDLFGRALPELCPAAALDAPCPGCGSTRAVLQLAHGRVADAWSAQPGVFPLALLPALLLLPAASRRRGRRLLFAAAVSLYLATWLIP